MYSPVLRNTDIDIGCFADNNSINSINSLGSAYERSSTSSSISGWAPRARSSSVSSHGSNDSVNLDALIASGSDINEECPLDLEEGDDVEWAKEQQQQRAMMEREAADGLPRSRTTTGESDVDMLQYDDHEVVDFWRDSEMPETEDDEKFDEALRDFSQMAMRSPAAGVRGLAMTSNSTLLSRFPDGRNPYDLEADYMDTPAGLLAGNRSSTLSNYSNYSNTSSNRSSISKFPASASASGLKAPSSRLVQPGARSMLAQPKAGAKSGIARPSGLQAPKAGSSVPRSGLQAPRAGSSVTTARGSSIAKPGASSMAAPGRTGIPATRGASAVSRMPSNTTTRPGVKSQIAPPATPRRNTTGAASAISPNRQSLLPAPSSIPSRNRSATTLGRAASISSHLTSPHRSATSSNLLASPTRTDRQSGSSYMISPTSSQSSTSSLQSLAMSSSGRDNVTPLSQRLSNATGTSQLRSNSGMTGRSMSMYGSSSLLVGRDSYQQYHHQDEEEDYSVLTPPQSPSSSKTGSRVLTGIPRSGIAAPSRLAAPLPATRNNRALSPSNSGGHMSMLPRPNSPAARMTSGLISPRAGRH
ncbi:hypothetical protein BGZ99_004097 [Dissophora globulifera]|uniref:Uncharacterized protein n=1 Tax=Dissophora globulifera TaxID=979702 RepID=A0A9P6RKM6_9FUNG|nr:hypothetical protein BGZ99_004097 [Dissophora globulifera]